MSHFRQDFCSLTIIDSIRNARFMEIKIRLTNCKVLEIHLIITLLLLYIME